MERFFVETKDEDAATVVFNNAEAIGHSLANEGSLRKCGDGRERFLQEIPRGLAERLANLKDRRFKFSLWRQPGDEHGVWPLRRRFFDVGRRVRRPTRRTVDRVMQRGRDLSSTAARTER